MKGSRVWLDPLCPEMTGLASKLKQLVERTKQAIHVDEPTFRPTPNTRNPAMLVEAEEFGRTMRQSRQVIRNYGKAVESEAHLVD